MMDMQGVIFCFHTELLSVEEEQESEGGEREAS
jgi:hypothetical protein